MFSFPQMPITVKLQSCDREFFDVDLELALQFGTIRTLIESTPNNEDDPQEIIFPLRSIDASVARLVIEFANYHKDDLKSRIATDNEEYWVLESMIDWDSEFLHRLDQITLFELISAANFLDYQPLMDATSKKIASMITGKTEDQIIEAFHLKRNPGC